MEGKEMNPAEEVLKTINTSIEEKTNEVAVALEAKATELAEALEGKASNETIETLKGENITLQKQMDDLENRVEKGIAAPSSKSAAREEFESKFAAAQEVMKKGGTATLDLKTFVAGSSSSTLVPSAYAQEAQVYHNPNFKMQLRDVLTSRSEKGGSIIWNRETAETDSAGVKAFGSAATQTSKTLTRQESTFRTIMNFYTMPEEYFNDISNFESYISNRLMGDLMDAESRQILSGDGTGNNFNGLNALGSDLSPAGASLAAARTAQDTALGAWANSIDEANRHDAIVAVSSLLEEADFTPGCVILNPFDFNQLSLIKATTGEYVLHQAMAPTGQITHYLSNGLQVIKSNAQTADYFTIFDKSTVEYVMREGVSLEFDRNANDFQTNSISVRAIVRGNIADWLPDGVYVAKFSDDSTNFIAGVVNGLDA